jgi:nucleotide sugar dehydrogenase
MTIGIIGSEGYVGKAFCKMVENHYHIVKYDPALGNKSASKEEINRCHLGVVCVPTPMNDDYSCDTSIVEETIDWLDTEVILIKSTIEPGTTDRLKKKTGKRIVFSPEYIGEGKYKVSSRMDFQTDMTTCPFLILGGDKEDCEYILSMLVPILGPEKIYECIAPLEAELIKYFENTYFGVKITFAQEMYEICKRFGVNYWNVRRGWALDPRVDVMHTAVFPNARGFSGKCLPKDIYALIKASQKKGYEPEFFKETLRSNNRIREEAGFDPDYEI